ncbi:MAG: hypothetical protein EOO77_24215 [Oxalobacteraceae bacterium]|nr:MAG: hypothetical protein EOO77_24215 [Oxalobacteraceae bacterium]
MMVKNYFRIIDRLPIPEGGLSQFRRRLKALYGDSFFVRVGESWTVAREVWESPEGQRFSILTNRRGAKIAYSLAEVAYEEHEVVERTQAKLKHKLVTRVPERDFA